MGRRRAPQEDAHARYEREARWLMGLALGVCGVAVGVALVAVLIRLVWG